MLINTPISLGELVDKISILIIKQKNIIDKAKLEYVNKEFEFKEWCILFEKIIAFSSLLKIKVIVLP